MLRRGATAILHLRIRGVDPDQIDRVHVTLDQNGKQLDKTLDDEGISLESTGVKAELSQAETLGFQEGTVQIQARGVMKDGKAFATQKVKRYIDDVLLDGEI